MPASLDLRRLTEIITMSYRQELTIQQEIVWTERREIWKEPFFFLKKIFTFYFICNMLCKVFCLNVCVWTICWLCTYRDHKRLPSLLKLEFQTSEKCHEDARKQNQVLWKSISVPTCWVTFITLRWLLKPVLCVIIKSDLIFTPFLYKLLEYTVIVANVQLDLPVVSPNKWSRGCLSCCSLPLDSFP